MTVLKLVLSITLLFALVAPAPSGAARAVDAPGTPAVDVDTFVAAVTRVVAGAPGPELPRPPESTPSGPGAPVSADTAARMADALRGAVDGNVADAAQRVEESGGHAGGAREVASRVTGELAYRWKETRDDLYRRVLP